jgi:putative SOS response-associated peptidase YedK
MHGAGRPPCDNDPMCGRYQLEAHPQELAEAFGLDAVPEEGVARYNVAPTQDAAVVRVKHGTPEDRDKRKLVTMRWGLVPHFARDLTGAARAINARAETVDSKPMFRDAFQRRRCIVPARGFYEWRRMGKVKQPYLLKLKRGELIGFAALWARWRDPKGRPVDSFSIVTRAANAVVTPIHDRMPVILPRDGYDAWLDPDAKPGLLKSLLAGKPNAQLVAVPVSTRVNDVTCDDPECARPVELDEAPQKSLF